MALILAIIGAAIIAAGIALIYLPAGIITAGLLLVAAAYIARYLEAHTK